MVVHVAHQENMAGAPVGHVVLVVKVMWEWVVSGVIMAALGMRWRGGE